MPHRLYYSGPGTTLGSNSDASTTNGLSAINITGTSAVTANGTIKATTLTIGDGSNTASLNLAASKSITGKCAYHQYRNPLL